MQSIAKTLQFLIALPFLLAFDCCTDPVTIPLKALESDGKIQWLGEGGSFDLSILQQQSIRTGQTRVEIDWRYPNCQKLMSEPDFKNLSSELKAYHNSLRMIGQAAVRSSKAGSWATAPAEQEDFRVSFAADQATTSGDAGATYQGWATARISGQNKRSQVHLAVALISRVVHLEKGARDCVRQNICGATGNGGEYISGVTYGTLIRAKVQSAEWAFGAGASGGKGPVEGSATFDLKSGNVRIDGAIIGGLKEPLKELEKEYDLPEIMEDLNKRRIIDVARNFGKLAKSYGVIAVETSSVSSTDCKLINQAREAETRNPW
jgi:hypothetical protein